MGIFFRSDTIFVPFLVHRAPKRKRGVVGAAPYSSIELLTKLQFAAQRFKSLPAKYRFMGTYSTPASAMASSILGSI